MNTKRLIRDIHHWGSIIVALPIVVMIGAGILLMLKKEIAWIQPPTEHGRGLDIQADGTIDAQPLAVLFSAAQSARPQSFSTWDELDRVDIKPGRDIVKFVSKDRWEVQVDLATAEVLQVSFRRSDLIESIHDGSWFADSAKLFLFLPAGLILFVLWLSGLYLFFLPHYKNWQKRKARQQGGASTR